MIGLLVALAGGIGTVLRFMVDTAVAHRVRGPVPLGTIVVNVTGSFLLGVVTGLTLDQAGLADFNAVVGTGVLGGYTTFSTASFEAVIVARSGGPRCVALATLHSGGMLLASLAAGLLGLQLA